MGCSTVRLARQGALPDPQNSATGLSPEDRSLTVTVLIGLAALWYEVGKKGKKNTCAKTLFAGEFRNFAGAQCQCLRTDRRS